MVMKQETMNLISSVARNPTKHRFCKLMEDSLREGGTAKNTIRWPEVEQPCEVSSRLTAPSWSAICTGRLDKASTLQFLTTGCSTQIFHLVSRSPRKSGKLHELRIVEGYCVLGWYQQHIVVGFLASKPTFASLKTALFQLHTVFPQSNSSVCWLKPMACNL